MKELLFNTEPTERVLEEFEKGFSYMALRRLPHGEVVAVLFSSDDERKLLVESEMHDISERSEIGVLKFSTPGEDVGRFQYSYLPDEFKSGVKLSKLVAKQEYVSAESGIVIRGRDGAEIVLVAGVCPHSIAISAPFIEYDFDPEFPINEYSRVEM